MLVGPSLSAGRSPLTSSLRRHHVGLTRREHCVIGGHLAAAYVPGCSLGAHMGHMGASTAESRKLCFCQRAGCITSGTGRDPPHAECIDWSLAGNFREAIAMAEHFGFRPGRRPTISHDHPQVGSEESISSSPRNVFPVNSHASVTCRMKAAGSRAASPIDRMRREYGRPAWCTPEGPRLGFLKPVQHRNLRPP
jgi:hypothetical protein